MITSTSRPIVAALLRYPGTRPDGSSCTSYWQVKNHYPISTFDTAVRKTVS